MIFFCILILPLNANWLEVNFYEEIGGELSSTAVEFMNSIAADSGS